MVLQFPKMDLQPRVGDLVHYHPGPNDGLNEGEMQHDEWEGFYKGVKKSAGMAYVPGWELDAIVIKIHQNDQTPRQPSRCVELAVWDDNHKVHVRASATFVYPGKTAGYYAYYCTRPTGTDKPKVSHMTTLQEMREQAFQLASNRYFNWKRPE